MAYSESQKRATMKYAKNNLKRIPLNVQLTDYDIIKSAAKTADEPINTYIKKAVTERMIRDGVVDKDFYVR